MSLYHQHVEDAPRSPDRAKARLNHCLGDGTVVFSRHFREELGRDKLTTADVLSVCRSGAIIMAPEKDIRTGRWKYRIQGPAAGRRQLAAVLTFRRERAVLITDFEVVG